MVVRLDINEFHIHIHIQIHDFCIPEKSVVKASLSAVRPDMQTANTKCI